MASQQFIIEHENRIINHDFSQLDDLWAGVQAERKTNVSQMNPVGHLNIENRSCWSTLLLNLMMAYLKHTQGEDKDRVLALMREINPGVGALQTFWTKYNLDPKGPPYVPSTPDSVRPAAPCVSDVVHPPATTP